MRAAVLSLFVALAFACGDDGSDKSDPEPGKGEAKAGDDATEASVPNTEEALTDRMTSLVGDIKAGNDAEAAATLESLALPEPREFFQELYSDDVVARLVEDYGDAREHLPELADIIRQQLDKGRTQIVVESFDDPNDRKAVGYQTAALREMRKQRALYSVRLVGEGPDDAFHIWSFMHDGKKFRWVGKLPRVEADIADKRKKRLELRVERAMQIVE